jgi:zinc transport system permease protein
MLDSFLIYSILTGIAIAASLCPLGCVVLWRKMPYFGDAVSHSAVLGIVLGLMLRIDTTIAIMVVSVVFSILLISMKDLVSNVMMVIISYSFLALGLFLLPFLIENTQVDIYSYLFGDILLVGMSEMNVIIAASILVLTWLYLRWQKLLMIAINKDIAHVDGINTKRVDFEFFIITSFMIAIAIKIVGVMLIASMLVVPAASARNVSVSPSGMLVKSIIFGSSAVSIGIYVSYLIDGPSGPSIVLASVVLFCFSTFLKRKELY